MSLGILRILGIVIFVYLMWRNLKDNYEEDKIITYSWVALLSFFIAGRISYGLINFGVWNDSWTSWFAVWNKPGMDYVGGFMALILINFIFSKVNNWKFMPFCEDGLNNILIFLVFLMSDEFIRARFDLKIGFCILLLVIMAFFVKFAKKRYRSLVWYKSGKKGFAFLSACFFGFLLLGLMGVLFRISIIYSVSYWIISLISLVGLCILGGVYEKRK